MGEEERIYDLSYIMQVQVFLKWLTCLSREVARTQDLLPNQSLIPCYTTNSPKSSNL